MHACLKKHNDGVEETRKGIEGFAERHGLKITGFKDRDILSFENDKPPNTNWKRLAGGWTPKSSTKAGRVLKEEMECIPQRPFWLNLIDDVAKLHSNPISAMKANVVGTIGYQKHVASEVFFVNCDEYWIPSMEGIEEVSLGEYRERLKALSDSKKEAARA